ncbi:uncharacterized protein L3040_006446 [Drepanopeziza brunnea f. sp. 'multigermtubi']|uniref:uncharacterized protein n=1 Tax=Drepanopeziza brunnea f. sp. 'multigermtubi' TaxID=698441 RepID=UPI0023A1C2FA|nr:hypothetical protein L3040_006446 [Drepanopeziza brunnea f. sp. 'multigermtubi']
MSDIDEAISHAGFDAADHQTAYVYAPAADPDQSARPSKRRKVSRSRSSVTTYEDVNCLTFEPLLEGLETLECANLRKMHFERAWSSTEGRIQTILDEANEGTVAEVTAFVNEAKQVDMDSSHLATGFVVTGPNITSQGLLFSQLSTRLREEANGPVVVLRSGDASNLKAVLKKLIRDATNQDSGEDDEDENIASQRDGRKLLNYDLEILHGYVELHSSRAVVIAFQDSEAFDFNLVADLIGIFSSWRDRIPFVLLFSIATSVDLFHERLPRAASRCLEGRQFDVEQTSSLLDRMFQKAVAGVEAPLRLGAGLLSSLIDRQEDHVQSIQSFIAALKFAYMCHFYGNPLSIFTGVSDDDDASIMNLVQPQHLELIRMLPSFRKLSEDLVDAGETNEVQNLLEDDKTLLREVLNRLQSGNAEITRVLRAMHLVAICSLKPVTMIELYITVFQGNFIDSDFIRSILDSVKRMAPEDLVEFIRKIRDRIHEGFLPMDLDGWADHDAEFVGDLAEVQTQISSLLEDSKANGKPVRSSYAIHSKGVRTTVIAQRVQLSYEKSMLSGQDKEFTTLVDRLSQILLDYFTIENPREIFLNEVWLFNSTSPYTQYFTPRPRENIEQALSAPYHYLNCQCCEPSEGLSSTHPATAILYQMYLETGSLINIFDLWSAFLEMISGGDDQKVDERDALVLFYMALADLKSLGMIKQSKKKADHLAKVAWKGL